MERTSLGSNRHLQMGSEHCRRDHSSEAGETTAQSSAQVSRGRISTHTGRGQKCFLTHAMRLFRRTIQKCFESTGTGEWLGALLCHGVGRSVMGIPRAIRELPVSKLWLAQKTEACRLSCMLVSQTWKEDTERWGSKAVSTWTGKSQAGLFL